MRIPPIIPSQNLEGNIEEIPYDEGMTAGPADMLISLLWLSVMIVWI